MSSVFCSEGSITQKEDALKDHSIVVDFQCKLVVTTSQVSPLHFAKYEALRNDNYKVHVRSTSDKLKGLDVGMWLKNNHTVV